MRAARLTVGWVLVIASCAGGGDAAVDVLAPAPAEVRPRAPVGGALPGLTSAELARFQAGRDEFMTTEEADEGLGPVFNEASCVACHKLAAVGGASTRLETRFGRLVGGVFDPMAYLGGSLLQDHATACAEPEQVPMEATIVAGRRTTALFGLGLVDAVPDDSFERLAAIEAQSPDGIGGHVAHVANVVTGGTSVGKFGWKAGVPSLLQFSGDAYLNEMGITSPRFMSENCPQGDCAKLAGCDPLPEPEDDGTSVARFADFMTLLAPPPPAGDDGPGEELFEAVGCAGCHTPTLRTGASAVHALDHVTFHPFGDFLLHDMGALGDGIVQGDASGRELRTAPLWGVRYLPALLHDGRAKNVDEAIRAHDGQARAARDRYEALGARRQQQLIAFVEQL
jgi:CxxC motif-containing protein (DUF1111 family)